MYFLSEKDSNLGNYHSASLSTNDLLAAARKWLQGPSLSLVGPETAVDAAAEAWREHPLSRRQQP